MKKIIAAIAVAAALIGFATPSQAGLLSIFQPKPKVVATVSISQQKMFLAVTNGRGQTTNYVWTVSTGRNGFETPTGQYQPTWLSKDHKSAQYEDAPMPFAVFFTGGYAVHATEAVSQLGKPASHGCVRLAPENAEAFFDFVETYGKFNTKIIVTGARPTSLRAERAPPSTTPVSPPPPQTGNLSPNTAAVRSTPHRAAAVCLGGCYSAAS